MPRRSARLTFAVPSGTLRGMENNRDRLLACAIELFSARGFDGVGVQEVADAAGLKKPTLYHYFGSKGGLLKTLLEESFADLFTVLEQVEYRREVVTTLEAVAKAYFDFAQRQRSFYRMQLSMWFAPSASEAFRAVAAINEKQQQILEALFLQAAQDHGNMRGRHQAYAATFLGTLNTYIALALNGYAELDDELVRKAVHQFMHGIFS
jgi:AcrR family transcriptional regulator